MDKRLRREVEERPVRVIEIDMERRRIVVEDNFGSTLYASMHFNQPVLSIPTKGELWLAKRRGIDWFLDRRQDTGVEEHAITGLQPGDRRLYAQNNVFIDGDEVYLNGIAVSEILDRLTYVENRIFPSTSREVRVVGA